MNSTISNNGPIGMVTHDRTDRLAGVPTSDPPLVGAGRHRRERCRGPRPDHPQPGTAHARRSTCTRPPGTCSGSRRPTAWCWPRRCCPPDCSATGSAARRYCWSRSWRSGPARPRARTRGPRRADRGPRGTRAGRRGDPPDFARRAARPVRPGGAGRAIAVSWARRSSLPVGPLLGGWLLDNFWWGSVFLINVPVVVLALVAVALLMPESRGPEQADRHPRDHPVQPGPGRLTYGLIKAGEKGWGDPAAMATIPAGVAFWSCSSPGSAGPAVTARRSWSCHCSPRLASPGARS